MSEVIINKVIYIKQELWILNICIFVLPCQVFHKKYLHSQQNFVFKYFCLVVVYQPQKYFISFSHLQNVLQDLHELTFKSTCRQITFDIWNLQSMLDYIKWLSILDRFRNIDSYKTLPKFCFQKAWRKSDYSKANL